MGELWEHSKTPEAIEAWRASRAESTSIRHAAVHELRARGWVVEAIADALGYRDETVRKILARPSRS